MVGQIVAIARRRSWASASCTGVYEIAISADTRAACSGGIVKSVLEAPTEMTNFEQCAQRR